MHSFWLSILFCLSISSLSAAIRYEKCDAIVKEGPFESGAFFRDARCPEGYYVDACVCSRTDKPCTNDEINTRCLQKDVDLNGHTIEAKCLPNGAKLTVDSVKALFQQSLDQGKCPPLSDAIKICGGLKYVQGNYAITRTTKSPPPSETVTIGSMPRRISCGYPTSIATNSSPAVTGFWLTNLPLQSGGIYILLTPPTGQSYPYQSWPKDTYDSYNCTSGIDNCKFK